MTKKNSNSQSHKSSKRGLGSQSKLTKLHRKLTLKTQNSASANRERQINGAPDPVATSHAKIKRKKLYQRASPMKLIKLYPHMTPQQVLLVQKAHFGGLTTIAISKLYPELCKYLMECFNPNTCELVFPGRGSIPVTEESVYVVLGVPWGNEDVRYELDSDSTVFMNKQMGHFGKTQPTMKFLEKKILQSKNADWTYLRLWTVYAMSSVVAPTTGTQVSPRIYPSFCNIRNSQKLNVCKFVIRMLRKAAKSGVDKGILKASMLYFMVKYLDSLELEGVDIDQEGTRVSVWTNSLVKKAILQDTHSDGTFGKARLKPEFTNKDVQSDKSSSEHHGTTPAHSESGRSEGHEATDFDQQSSHEQDGAGTGFEQMLNNQQEDEETAGKSSSEQFYNQGDQNVKNDQAYGQNQDHDGSADSRTPDVNISRNESLRSEENMEHQSVLFSEGNISRFVKMYTPETSTHKENQLYMQIVKESCYGFEKSLHNIITKLVCKPVQETHRPKRKERNPVSKIRRSRLSASQSDQSVHSSGRHERGKESGAEFARTSKNATRSDSPVQPDEELKDAVNTETVQGGTPDKLDKSEDVIITEVKHQSKDKETPLVAQSENNTAGIGVTVKSHQIICDNNKVNEMGDCPRTCELTETEPILEAKGGRNAPMNDSIHQEPITESIQLNTTELNTTELTDKAFPPSDAIQFLQANYRSNSGNSTSGDQEEQEEQELIGEQPDSDIFNIRKKQASKFDFFKFVKGDNRSEEPEPNILHFEEPFILDLHGPKLGREEVNKCLKGMKEISLNNEDGLPNMIDGNLRPELKQILLDMEPRKDKIRKRKAVTFADELQSNQKGIGPGVATPSKIRTRSVVRAETEAATPSKAPTVSPAKTKNAKCTPSPRKKQVVTRSLQAKQLAAGSPSPAERGKEGIPEMQTEKQPSPVYQDSMIRKLHFSSSEGEKRKFNMDAAPDAPSFDLGFDSQDKFVETEMNKPAAPTTEDDPNGSKTPVPHEYQKRLIRAPKCLQSPYIDYENKKVYTVSKAVDELYKMVCNHGTKTSSTSNGIDIFDNGELYLSLGALADSVKPGKKLVNMACEVGIHIITAENRNSKKVIAPLRVSRYLTDCRFNLKDVKRLFCPTDTYRLDHKELICFPTLQSFGGSKDYSSGHYWLVNLNIKARRFELMDPMTNNKDGEPIMMEACHLLVAGIKTQWAKEYPSSSIDISQFPMVPIPCPKQTNGYDCGFFMLKILESWHGRKMENFSQSDMPNIRKLYNDKWLRWHENRAEWKIYV